MDVQQASGLSVVGALEEAQTLAVLGKTGKRPGGVKFPGGTLGDADFGRRGSGAARRLGDLECRLRRCRGE